MLKVCISKEQFGHRSSMSVFGDRSDANLLAHRQTVEEGHGQVLVLPEAVAFTHPLMEGLVLGSTRSDRS